MRCSSSNSDYCLFTRLGITSYYLDMSHTLAKCGPAEFSMPVKTELEISGAELTSNVKLHNSYKQANLTSPLSPVSSLVMVRLSLRQRLPLTLVQTWALCVSHRCIHTDSFFSFIVDTALGHNINVLSSPIATTNADKYVVFDVVSKTDLVDRWDLIIF